MQRRTVLRRIGATTAVGVGVAGTASGERARAEFGLDRSIDVSAVSGTTTFGALLDEEELAAADVDPSRTLRIAPGADQINFDHQGCCVIECPTRVLHDCICTVCERNHD